MPGVFISYRRSGANVMAYRIADELQHAFGQVSVFLDVESIDSGLPFAEAIQSSLDQCSVALIVIGPKWLTMTNDDGVRRLDMPNDWVRREVSLALRSKLRVIPVLVEGAAMPEASELPEDIRALAELQAFTFVNSQAHWSFDVDRLKQQLSQLDKSLAKKYKPQKESSGYSYKAISGLILALLLWLTYVTEGYTDNDEAIGAIVIFAVAIGLCYWGFKDIKAGLVKGKAIAFGGMALGGLMILASLGELSQSGEKLSAHVVVPAQTNQIQSVAPVVKKHSNVSKVTSIAGTWSTDEGVEYEMVQNGTAISFTEYNAFGVQVGEGAGTLTGDTLNFEYYNSVVNMSGSGYGQFFDNQGDAMRINFRFSGLDPVVFDIYRD